MDFSASFLLAAFGKSLLFALAGVLPIINPLASAPVFAFANFVQPGLQGLMTRRVQPNEQGRLQGANQGLQGIASVLGPIIYGTIFAWSVHNDRTLHMPGLAILVASSLLGLALVLALKVGRPAEVAAVAA